QFKECTPTKFCVSLQLRAMADLRSRRIRNEWDLVKKIRQINREGFDVLGHETGVTEDLFRLVLHQTSGILKRNEFCLISSHQVAFRFPRFYPSVPIEAALSVPVFHPNVDSHTGFVCLWDKFSSGDTILEALSQVQRIISWELYDLNADQL